MTHKFLPLAAMAALALVACQERSTTRMATDGNAASATATDIPASNAVDAAPLPTAIPASLQGRWGLVPADCTSTRGDAKGLLTIGATDLKFYESRGTVAKVLAAATDSFDADYAFTGEGQEWTRIEKLSLADGKLRRQTVTQEGQEPGVDLSYQRCAA